MAEDVRVLYAVWQMERILLVCFELNQSEKSLRKDDKVSMFRIQGYHVEML